MLLNNPKNTVQAAQLPIEKLRPFEGHPFKVTDDAEMEQLTWSILTQGLLTPITVRPIENNGYEVISGHRRLHACQKAGIETVPALIYSLDRDAAAIALVDSNLHREKILPSERAFAYKLKLDAMNHQGRSSGQVVQKWTRDEIAEGESGRQVQRYIRLTELIPELIQMVDDGKIALTPAVELSYLNEWEQRDLLETMLSEDCTPSLSQAIQMKSLSQSGNLDIYTIFDILTQRKPNQQEKISFKVSEIREYFPRGYTAFQMTCDILKGLELLRQRREQNRDSR